MHHQRATWLVRVGMCLLSLVMSVDGAQAQVFGPPQLLLAEGGIDSTVPRVAGDGAGTWIAVWSSQSTLGGTVGADSDILFSRSTDDGLTWSAVAPLNSRAAVDSEYDALPQIATDGSGTWVVVWQSGDDLGGTISDRDDILMSRSLDGGLTWSAQAPINQDAITSPSIEEHRPTLTTDGTTWLATWEVDTGDRDIFYARSTDGGATFSSTLPLNTIFAPSPEIDVLARVAHDGLGTWIVVWGSYDTLGGTIGADPDILFVRSLDSGLTWSAPMPVSSAAATDSRPDERPDIAYGNGTWTVVWKLDADSLAGDDDELLMARSTDGGANWSATTTLNTDAAVDDRFDDHPHVVTDGTGNWAVVWGPGTTHWTDMWIARSTDDALSWTAPVMLESGRNRDATLANAGATWVLVWQNPDREMTAARSFQCANDADCAHSNECATTVCDPVDPDADPSGCVYGSVAAATPCSDDDACTTDDACTVDVCIPGAPPVCARCEICTAAEGCIVAPRTGCRQASVVPGSLRRRSTVFIRNKDNDNGDKVKWKFRKSSSLGFGNPLSTTDYTLCVYDEGGAGLVFSAAAPAGGQCAARDCWRAAGDGFKYRDRELTPDGLLRIQLAPSRIAVAGKGGSLGLPTPLDIDLPVVVQLRTSDADCWDATYYSVGVRNHEPDRFKATAGSPGKAFVSPVTIGLLD